MSQADKNFLRRMSGYFFRTVPIEKLAYVLDLPKQKVAGGIIALDSLYSI